MVSLVNGCTFRFTSFYGNPNQAYRFHSWNLLQILYRECNESWLCCGDFNEVLDINEVCSFRTRLISQIEARLDRGFGNLSLIQHWGGFLPIIWCLKFLIIYLSLLRLMK